MKIDVFNHFLPKNIYENLREIAPHITILDQFAHLPTLWDIDAHLRLMDEYDGYQQVLSLSNPPIEMLGSPQLTPELARRANDGLAALCKKYPERFPAFIASLPMNNPEAAVKEAERAINELDARGIQIFTNVLGKPLSAPEFYPIFETMAKHDLPIWVHPMRGPNFADYASETVSEAEVWFTFGWPYETSACMARLIFSGLFDKLPQLKIITHHMGGMIPYFSEKIGLGFTQIFDGDVDRNPSAERAGLKKQPIEYYRMLYADTATNGSLAAMRCGHDFFKTDHCLFATDAPFDSQGGRGLIGGTIDAVNALDISELERSCIFEHNARKLLRLDK
ncbi:amidohydrolase family protein [Glaciimonas sp. PCH181]|uniref:amidohydrolase family protein n=1 Tax=Glaciimonas sp. PCH181 TaxID=2133943 RepID=UPI000D331FC6|nr:amidohydrolase family protein [Glaciimonas sp. PCH181]PUA19486.1 amidohydrolase [Glaciimonas sp. PCH181]